MHTNCACPNGTEKYWILYQVRYLDCKKSQSEVDCVQGPIDNQKIEVLRQFVVISNVDYYHEGVPSCQKVVYFLGVEHQL